MQFELNVLYIQWFQGWLEVIQNKLSHFVREKVISKEDKQLIQSFISTRLRLFNAITMEASDLREVFKNTKSADYPFYSEFMQAMYKCIQPYF